MIKKQIEKNQVQNHSYERYVLHSAILNQDVHCGILKQVPAEQIQKTIYLFHGGGADDTQTVQAGLLPVLAGLLSTHPETQIIMPFIGNSFLHDHPTQKSKSYSQYFLKDVIAACESGTQTKACHRYLAGWSMGGQAALNMFFRELSQFAGVGVHFATLVDFNYYDNQQAETYALRQNVTADMLKVLVEEFKKVFLNIEDFNNHNPLSLAKHISRSALENKKIYFDVGLQDEFGLSEGAQALHKILDSKGIPHHFTTLADGKHDGPFIHTQISALLKYLL